MRIAVAVGCILVAATPAVARDRMGSDAIASGDLARAERTLVAERRIFPDRPELMLNLAAVYARSGRLAEARSLYASVLDQAAVSLDLPSGGVASSHELAAKGQARLARWQVATR